MVKEPKTQVDNKNELFEEKQKIGLYPQFEKKEDKRIGEKPKATVTTEERERIEKICPHYFILRDRYAEYENYDDEGKNPIPLKIDRIHQLHGFEATLAQADPTKELEVTPTRLIKLFDFSDQQRKPFLLIDKRVIGIDTQGRSTNISSIRTGMYKYPTQFEQDRDGDWKPVTNQFKTILDTPFSKEEVEKYAYVGNPYTKKYAVWHPDGIRRGYFTLDDFLKLTDDEQITLIEQGKR